MEFDFSTVEDIETYASVPEGTYECRIAEVRETTTKDGFPRWAFRLEVADGDLAGRTAAWDGLTWSERALPRVKHVLDVLGYDVSGKLVLAPVELEGKRLRATFHEETHEDPLTGRKIVRMRVPFFGYERSAVEGAPF